MTNKCMSEFDIEERTRSKVEEIASSIKMQWCTPTYDGKILLLVEDQDDKNCYFKFFNYDLVEIRTSAGCNKMRHLFDILRLYSIPLFAIQDSDFARVCDKIPKEENYFITDCHDHEMMCLNNPKVMKAIFVNNAVNYDLELVKSAFDYLRMLSHFKWYNYKYHLNVNFRGYKVCGKKKEELCSFDAIYNTVKPHSPKCTSLIKEFHINDFIKEQNRQSDFELTNGHDFLDLMTQLIEEKYNLHGKIKNNLRTIMYSSFTLDCFKDTNLYRNVYTWAGEKADVLFVS